jgi:RIO-like serine/threonine protein kinase
MLREDTKFDDDFEIGDKLGEGAYSVVYRAVHRASGEAVAVKFAPKSKMTPVEVRRLQDEVAVLARLDHPHILRLHAFFDEPDRFAIVTELMTGGELFDRIVQRAHYSEREARDVVRTVAEAIAYMHSLGIAHRGACARAAAWNGCLCRLRALSHCVRVRWRWWCGRRCSRLWVRASWQILTHTPHCEPPAPAPQTSSRRTFCCPRPTTRRR